MCEFGDPIQLGRAADHMRCATVLRESRKIPVLAGGRMSVAVVEDVDLVCSDQLS